MKPDRTMIEVPPELVRRCEEWGPWFVEHLAKGGSPHTLALASHGAETNPVLQAQSKIAECIFALHMDLDPDSAVGWFSEQPDDTWDVLVGETRVDVKGTGLNSHFLIWPIRKNPTFDKKRFHVLALVKTDGTRGYVHGWIGKRSFRRGREIAGPGHPLTEGTRFMHEDKLHRMSIFPGLSTDWREHYCFCGEWGSNGSDVTLRKDRTGQWHCAEHDRERHEATGRS